MDKSTSNKFNKIKDEIENKEFPMHTGKGIEPDKKPPFFIQISKRGKKYNNENSVIYGVEAIITDQNYANLKLENVGYIKCEVLNEGVYLEDARYIPSGEIHIEVKLGGKPRNSIYEEELGINWVWKYINYDVYGD